MDPADLESSLPQSDNPCLIVEDSQPDSVALEDDPESSYRALLARRLSSLQPSARSPVLELISSPLGIRCSQTDTENSQSNNQTESETNQSSAHQEREASQVLDICPAVNNKKKRSAEDTEMDSGADSTTHCQTEEGNSQFGFLELSQSQDLCGDTVNSQKEDVAPQADDYKRNKSAEQSAACRTSQDIKSVRSEVSSSCSSDSQSGRQLSVQVLLHSEGLQDQLDLPSSQEDMFNADKSGGAVDSTVSEPEQQSRPTPTPSNTLRLLHLSGQGTLVQESLSQSSVDFIAPTPNSFSQTPLIVPSSPTEPERDQGADEPMDTSLPPDDVTAERDEEQPMEMENALKPHPSASTPVSQNSPGFALDRTLTLPSQPEFSHDVFVPTPSLDPPRPSDKRSQSQHADSAPFTLPLQLSANTQSDAAALNAENDSQATQIEEFDEAPPVDTSDSAGSKSNCLASETRTGLKPSKCQNECADTGKSSNKNTAASLHAQNLNVKDGKVVASGSCSQPKLGCDASVNSCIQETPSNTNPSPSVIAQAVAAQSHPLSQPDNIMDPHTEVEEVEEVVMEDEQEEIEKSVATGGGASGLALPLSQSQLTTPELMENDGEDQGDDSVIVLTDSERDSQTLRTGVKTKTGGSQLVNRSVCTNGHKTQNKAVPDRLSQTERAGPESVGLKDKSLSDSSGEISFHFTLPKEGELIGPSAGATPPLINQLKQTLRHSTPIEITSFSEKSGDVSADVTIAASNIVSGDVGEDRGDEGDGKLSLRMKLVTPVEEGSSETFSLQKPSLSGEDTSVVKDTTVSKAVTSPSVFTRVRQVHRQLEVQDNIQSAGNSPPVRGVLFNSPQKSSQASSLGCDSLPNSQSEPSPQKTLGAPQQNTVNTPTPPADQLEKRRGPADALEPPTPTSSDARRKTVSMTPSDNTISTSLSKKQRPKNVPQQTSFDAAGFRTPSGRGEPESPSSRRSKGPSHCRHVRTIQEVRTTITRIITDVYYEDGKEVDRKVTEESEEPVVDCHVSDSDISPCRTGSSSLTSGDLADISSLSSKASSLQHSSGTSSSTGTGRPDFIIPSSRGGRSFSPRRGGGHQQRGHRGQRAGSVVTKGRGFGTTGSRAFVSLSPRGRVRRGRPPSRSSPSRGAAAAGSLHRLGAHSRLQSSSEDEPFAHMLPPRLPVSPAEVSRSDSLRSSPEEVSSAGSSFVGLRVVAKWSSNGYFYSGRIIRDAGEGKFRLRFDDGYECEVVGKDILLCDPIPLETEVTALLEDEYFSIGVVRDHKTEDLELFYSVEKDGQSQWYNRSSIILSLEQGNKLREQHSLGPYEPSTPLAKASDISLDNLVEGKRRRRVAPGGENTPTRSSSDSPHTPGPSSKRKLRTSSEDNRTPAKRGRRGSGTRAARRVGACNTSGSGTDLPGQSGDVSETHGPLPENTSLFMGFAFMLTASSESDRLTNKITEVEEEDYVQTGPFNKSYTESQLQAGGGFILPDFNEEQCKAAYQSLLIADQHSRTRKYLLCLASGVPCVSNIWVRDCCKENKLLNYRNYLLPAGMGPEDNIVEWHPRCSPFKSLRVLLAFETPVELWNQLITMGGASSVRQFQADKDDSDIPSGKYDVVVTDHTCPPLVEKSMTSQEVPLVSPEWLIQSVISGERIGFHSNPQYRHDYSS